MASSRSFRITAAFFEGERALANVAATDLSSLLAAVKDELGVDQGVVLAPHYMDPDFDELVELDAFDELSISEGVHHIVLQARPEDLARVAAMVLAHSAPRGGSAGGDTHASELRRFTVTIAGTDGVPDGTAAAIRAADLDGFWLEAWRAFWQDRRPLPVNCTSWEAAAAALEVPVVCEMFDEDFDEFCVPASMAEIPDAVTIRWLLSKGAPPGAAAPAAQAKPLPMTTAPAELHQPEATAALDSTPCSAAVDMAEKAAAALKRWETKEAARVAALTNEPEPEPEPEESAAEKAKREEKDAAEAAEQEARATAMEEVRMKRVQLLADGVTDASEAKAKAALAACIDEWLADDVGIGGNAVGGGAHRTFDPTDMIQFAWARQLEAEDPERIYQLFVDAQQVAAKSKLYSMLAEGGGGAPPLSATELRQPVLDLEQFASRAGWLRHEARKGKWSDRYALLWRDPRGLAAGEMMLLLYDGDTADQPLEIVEMISGGYNITPPKAPRKEQPHCFRLNIEENKARGLRATKWVLAAAGQSEYSDWLSALTQDSAAQLIAPNTPSRAQAKAAQQAERAAQAQAMAKLALKIESTGLLKAVTSTAAATLTPVAVRAGWVRREKAKDKFERSWLVIWRHPDPIVAIASTTNDLSGPEGGGGDFVAAFYPSDEAPRADWAARLRHGHLLLGAPKKPRSNCPHCLRLDEDGVKGDLARTKKPQPLGPLGWKLVLGADSAAGLEPWQQTFATLFDGDELGQKPPRFMSDRVGRDGDI